MRTSAPLTTVSATPRSSRAAAFAGVFTIRSIFFVKFLAAAELAAASSKHFSAASPAKVKIDNVVPICVTTCRSRSKKQPLARKKKSKFANSTFARNAAVVEPNRDHAVSIARFAAAAARLSAHADFSRSRRLVRVAAVLATSWRNHAATATAKDGGKRPAE